MSAEMPTQGRVTTEGAEAVHGALRAPREASGREGVPVPLLCPFRGCDTGPLGREALNAHIEHCPHAKTMQDRINNLKRQVDEHEAYSENGMRDMFGDYPRSEP